MGWLILLLLLALSVGTLWWLPLPAGGLNGAAGPLPMSDGLGGDWYSRSPRSVPEGARIWVRIPKLGYWASPRSLEHRSASPSPRSPRSRT